ncbi:MAG: hypothetical protein H0X03_06025 [Nitrosopumilus sp.]|nr:hypothetical protein [Nitrosopumilus sp.]
MGRTIPSFRILMEIEAIERKYFRKKLCKEDKVFFNKLFSIPKLYCHYLSNLSKPIIIEKSSILAQNKSITNQNNLESIQLNKQTKMNVDIDTNNHVIEVWKFSDCINKDDKNTFNNMITDCYNDYHNSINSNIKDKSDSCLTRTTSQFMALFLYQQKQINLIKSKQGFLN